MPDRVPCSGDRPGTGPLEQGADLAEFLERAGMADDAFSEMDTWAAALTLSNRARTLDRGQNVDLALIGGGRETAGLESYDTQYAIFDALPPDGFRFTAAPLAVVGGASFPVRAYAVVGSGASGRWRAADGW